MIRKFMIFRHPIAAQERWLNEMSEKGYRLAKAGKLFYYFEESKPKKYNYAVQYTANMSLNDLNNYEEHLKDMNIRYIEKSGKLGKVSIGNIRWRPYADKGGKIATSGGMINKEFLILEKENDGKPFEIFTTLEDKIKALKTLRKPNISIAVFIAFFLFLNAVNFSGYQYSFFEFKPFLENKTITIIILSILEIIFLLNILKFTYAIRKLKQESNLHE